MHLLVIALFVGATAPAAACTSILVTKGASADGSVIITYCCDLLGLYNELPLIPAADHKPGEMIDIPARDDKEKGKRPAGKIPQVPHTYKMLGYMNEHQVAIAETTFGGRPGLHNPLGLMDCEPLMIYALQRARTAREAIKVMTELAEKYGYCDEGESFSIGDTQEAWILEMVGTGPNSKGAIWAAVRVPDGQVSCTANLSRIGEIAQERPGELPLQRKRAELRREPRLVQSQVGRAVPLLRRLLSRHADAAADLRYASMEHLAAGGAVEAFVARLPPLQARHGAYPLCLPPDAKVTVASVFALLRDHYEGTDYDMTQGIDAGPFGLPSRWRPLQWKVDGADYVWERPISTQQTAFSFVSQSRSWMPDAVGGLYWYGVDNTFTTCFVPLYCCIEAAPKSYIRGSNRKFTLDSAWWTFNMVTNYAYLKWSMMAPEITACQKDLETNFLALQPAVEKTALELQKTSPNLAARYLTDYSVMHAEQTVARWRELLEHLIVKYNDGYVRDANGHYQEVGYPEAWLRRVLKERPEAYKIPPAEKK